MQAVGARGAKQNGALALVALVAGIIALWFARLLIAGWGPVTQDDARYVYLGQSMLHGRGPYTEAGTLYLLRSPVFGMALATPGAILGLAPFDGARVVAALFAAAALAGAVRLGYALGGLAAAVATAFLLVADPVVWWLLPGMRVDLAQAAGLLATLLAMMRTNPGRWALAGLLLGITILIKETAAPALLLPLAWLGAMPARRLAHLAAAFLGPAVLLCAVWWAFVWVAGGVVFPFNGVATVEENRQGVEALVRLQAVAGRPAGLGLFVVLAAGWLLLLRDRWREPAIRALAVTGASLVPAAVLAFVFSLHLRQYLGLLILSTVATGLAASPLLRRATAWARQSTRSSRLGVPVMVLGAVALIAAGQALVPGLPRPTVTEQAGRWLDANVQPGEVVLTTAESAYLAVTLYDRALLRQLSPVSLGAGDAAAEMVVLTTRGGRVRGISRETWRRRVGRDDVRYLVVLPYLGQPPEPLLTTLSGEGFGLRRLASLHEGEEDEPRGAIFEVTPRQVRATAPDLPSHATAAALLTWAASEPPAGEWPFGALLRTSPAEVAALDSRLPPWLCLTPAGSPYGADISRIASSTVAGCLDGIR